MVFIDEFITQQLEQLTFQPISSYLAALTAEEINIIIVL